MIDKRENYLLSPWNFGNNEEMMASPDNQNRIIYYNLTEFVMGSPLAGECCWIDNNGKSHLIDKLCGGPAIWNLEGNKIAVPVWKRTFLKGTIQKLIVVDIIKNELTLYKKTFKVLDLKTFDRNIVCGIDSPIHKAEIVQFDIYKEIIEEKKRT